MSSAASNSTQPPPSPFRAPASRREIRDQLEDMLIKDLLGPAGGEYEEIEEDRHVWDRYLVGMLAPKRQTLPPEQNDELALGIKGSSQDGQADVGAPGSAIPSLCPSSIGMTFSVDASAPGIRVTAKWGFYERVKSETAINPKTGGPAMVWKRRPISGTSKTIALTEGPIQPWIVDHEFPDVVVHGRMRSVGDCYLITLFLVNNQARVEAELRLLFDDSAPEVRAAAAGVFRVEGVLHSDVGGRLAGSFVRSAAFVEHSEDLLWSLSHDAVNLVPFSSSVFAAADRFANELADQTRSMQNRLGMAGRELSSLLLRLYDAATKLGDRSLAKDCLDRWDALLASRVGDADAHLESLIG